MEMNVKKHLDLLGFNVKDKVTGMSGVVTSIGFDLYGCIQAIVNTGFNKDGEPRSHWFDIARLEKLSNKRVMDLPDYDFGIIAEGRKGAAEKPMAYKV